MQILTWLTPTDETYCAATPRGAGDMAVPDRPADMPQGRYDRESGQWEKSYDRPDAADLTIAEAERLYAWADAQGDGMAGILLKTLGL